jgi:transcriptional regulator with XRE-family HTH domain
MTSEEIKMNFSQNLIELRKSRNLTQLQLAEKLNYSDKAISKWEVGAVMPDVETLSYIAEFFGITVNDLIYKKKKSVLRELYKNHVFISLFSYAMVWFLSTIVYFVLEHTTTLNRVWLTFIFTIPVSSIVLIVFSSIWFKKIHIYMSTSLMLWGIIISVYFTINNYSLWFIFIIGVVGQLAISFLMPLDKKKK